MMVRDMVGHRDGFDMVAFQLAQVNRDSGDALGILLFSYCKGSDPDEPGEARKPDLDRKERVLVPRETLSVQMIAGPRAEIQMRWALDSVQHIADEIRIGDTGLNARGLEAAADYGAVVVTVPDPLEEGFDVARNAVLDSTPDWVDWVLWIDSDEHLVGASHLWPLLRPSTWDAFAITQAHFAVEGKIEPDKPARCFRRHSTSTGESFRFFGHIHEHAELGEVNKGPGQHCDMPKIGLAHTGYVSHANRDKRLARNRPMMAKDRERFPTRILHNHLRMRDNMIEAAMEHHVVGHVTPHMRDLALETCQLFREHFLGQPRRQPGTQTLENYTKALSILGEGIECIIDVRAEREGVRGLTNGLTADEPFGCKFLDAKEYAIELAARAKLAAETLTSEHW